MFPLRPGSLELAGLLFPPLSSKEGCLVLCPRSATVQTSGSLLSMRKKVPVTAEDGWSALSQQLHRPAFRDLVSLLVLLWGLPCVRIVMGNFMETLNEM